MTEQSEAIGILTQVGIDVSDLGRAEAFYSALLGVKRFAAHDNYLNFEPLPGGLTVYLQKVARGEDEQDPGASGCDGEGHGRVRWRGWRGWGGKRLGSFLESGGGVDGGGRSGRQRTLFIAGLGSVFPEDGFHDVEGVVYVVGGEGVVGDETPILVSSTPLDT